jgi:hypothetical protein
MTLGLSFVTRRNKGRSKTIPMEYLNVEQMLFALLSVLAWHRVVTSI